MDNEDELRLDSFVIEEAVRGKGEMVIKRLPFSFY